MKTGGDSRQWQVSSSFMTSQSPAAGPHMAQPPWASWT